MVQLLADMMMFLLKAPFVIINWLNTVFLQRLATTRAISGVQTELAPVSKTKKFEIFFRAGHDPLWLALIALFVGIVVESSASSAFWAGHGLLSGLSGCRCCS